MQHKRADSPEFSILTATSDPEENTEGGRLIDRFELIRQKLDCYSRLRGENKEVQARQKLSCRLAELETRLIEQSIATEEKVEVWKEMLGEMRVQAQQQEKRCTALLKKRGQAIKQIHQVIEEACWEHQKEEERTEEKISDRFDVNFKALTESLQKECNECVSQINSTEEKFEIELPKLHERIATSNGYLHSFILRTQAEVTEHSQALKQLCHQQTQQQYKSDSSILHLIKCTARDIEDDLAAQRSRRRSMREKLQFLIETAIARLPHYPSSA